MDTVHSTEYTVHNTQILYSILYFLIGYEEERETDLNVDQFIWKLLV